MTSKSSGWRKRSSKAVAARQVRAGGKNKYGIVFSCISHSLAEAGGRFQDTDTMNQASCRDSFADCGGLHDTTSFPQTHYDNNLEVKPPSVVLPGAPTPKKSKQAWADVLDELELNVREWPRLGYDESLFDTSEIISQEIAGPMTICIESCVPPSGFEHALLNHFHASLMPFSEFTCRCEACHAKSNTPREPHFRSAFGH